MVNLLPKKEINILYRAYYVRLFTAWLLLVSCAILVGGALLVPSYVVSERAADSGERYLAALEETVGIRERAGVTDDVRALAERLRILGDYSSEVSYGPFFEDAFFELTSDIRVGGIAFTKGSDALQVSISGNAKTRTALLSFADRLRQSGHFEGVSVPVSQLAVDENIPFSITATYKN